MMIKQNERKISTGSITLSALVKTFCDTSAEARSLCGI